MWGMGGLALTCQDGDCRGRAQGGARQAFSVQAAAWLLWFGVFLTVTPQASVQPEKLTILGEGVNSNNQGVQPAQRKILSTSQDVTMHTSQKV